MHMARLHASQRRGKAAPASFIEVRDALDEVVFEVIERAKQDSRIEERDDILAMLFRVRYEDGSSMTDRDLRDTLVTMLIQGHASTTDGLSWALERVIRHPEIHERLSEEAKTDDEEYVDAVVKETLRLRPPLGMATRLVNKPFQLGEYELQPGTLIGPCIYLVHRRADIYPEPEQFRPERFLEQPPGKYTWIPFTAGNRSCLGGYFAMHEMKTVLRTIMRNVRLEPVEPDDEQPVMRRVGLSPNLRARAIVAERLTPAQPAGVAAA